MQCPHHSEVYYYTSHFQRIADLDFLDNVVNLPVNIDNGDIDAISSLDLELILLDKSSLELFYVSDEHVFHKTTEVSCNSKYRCWPSF